MHPLRRQRLWVVLSIVLFSSAAVGLAAYALRGNINLFYPPVEVAAGEAPLDTPIRVGGMVVDGSVQRADDSLEVRFQVTDYQATVDVVYVGILPDLFARGRGPWPRGAWVPTVCCAPTRCSPSTMRTTCRRRWRRRSARIPAAAAR
jgi:cytochrome c-type biogenesis protein CcmE